MLTTPREKPMSPTTQRFWPSGKPEKPLLPEQLLAGLEELDRTGKAVPGEAKQGSGAGNRSPGVEASGAPDDTGQADQGHPPKTKGPAYSTALVGLTDEELENWPKSKGFRYTSSFCPYGIYCELFVFSMFAGCSSLSAEFSFWNHQPLSPPQPSFKVRHFGRETAARTAKQAQKTDFPRLTCEPFKRFAILLKAIHLCCGVVSVSSLDFMRK